MRAATSLACLVAVLASAASALSCRRAPPPPRRSQEESAALVPYLYGDGQYGYVDRQRRPAFEPRFAGARRFHEGRAAIASSPERWGFIDADGRVVVSPKFSLVGDYRDGRARVIRFEKPILGPVMGLILKPGVVKESTMDLAGKESGHTEREANVLSPLAPDGPVFEELAPPPLSPPPRWEEYVVGRARGLREKASGREVLPPSFEDFRFVEDVDGTGVKFIAAHRAGEDLGDTRPRTWEIYTTDGKRIFGGASDVGRYASEGTFTVSLEPESWWGAVDASGKVVVAPFAAGPFAFRGGVAEAFVADVGVVFVDRDGSLYADRAYIDELHRRVGRSVDAGAGR
ncbi:MAG: WG repeat-containing protein [Deltaproteobacteria bacterium]|nr:WG repeat-containing protein [Deltaproteobacteria bacterium]